MRTLVHSSVSTRVVILGVLSWVASTPGQETQSKGAAQTTCIRDLLWVWCHTDMTKPGEHTHATFVSASPARRAELLGVPNVLMAGADGFGIPNNDEQADAWTREVATVPRLVWKIFADGNGAQPFVYTKRTGQVRKLVDKYPQIEGVLLDDMSTVGIRNGLKPEHIRQIRQLLDGKYAAVKVWGVLYTHSFNLPNIDDYIKELDVINLWTWYAKDVVKLEENVAHCEQKYPGKPIMLGLYLYDYGGGRRIPMDLVKQQCETALKLAHAGRIQGIVFLTINDDPEAVGWAADWIKRVGDQRLGSPVANSGASRHTNADQPVTDLKIGNGRDWAMPAGAWKEDAGGATGPGGDEPLAFYTPKAWRNMEIQCEVKLPKLHGDAGLILRRAGCAALLRCAPPALWASVVPVEQLLGRS